MLGILKWNIVSPRYELVSTSRLKLGDYPHHFLESFGRECGNPGTSERLLRFLSLALVFSHSRH